MRINKMVNKDNGDYHPGLSGVTSTIHTLRFLYPLREFYPSPEYLLDFLSNLYLARLKKISKFVMFRLLENTFACQKIESNHFYSCPEPQAKLSPRFLSSRPRQRETTHSPQEKFSRKSIPPAERGRGEETMNDNALKLFKVNNKDKTTFLLNFMSFWLILVYSRSMDNAFVSL